MSKAFRKLDIQFLSSNQSYFDPNKTGRQFVARFLIILSEYFDGQTWNLLGVDSSRIATVFQ